MLFVITGFSILNSARFVTSTFTETHFNYQYYVYVCNECHIAATHAKLLGVKIVTTTKGTYSTVSCIPYDRIVNLLETNDLNENWIFSICNKSCIKQFNAS